MVGWLLGLIAVGCLAGAVGWMRCARLAWERAQGLAHQRRPSGQWRTLAAKDGLGSLLFVGMALLAAAEAVDGHRSPTEALLVAGVVPVAASLGLASRFRQLTVHAAALEDQAQRIRQGATQSASLAERLARRVSGVDAPTVPGVAVRSLYQPVEGSLGGDFLGVGVSGPRLDIVVGDVTGHGFDAALEAMRLKDLLMGLLGAGWTPAATMQTVNAFVCRTYAAESHASAFVATYQHGVVRYASAGHPPAMVVGGSAERELAPTGPLLGVLAAGGFEQGELVLAPGERLLVVTDGLLEAYGPAGGLDPGRIAGLVREGGPELVHAALTAASNSPRRDDVAMLEVRRLPSDPDEIDVRDTLAPTVPAGPAPVVPSETLT